MTILDTYDLGNGYEAQLIESDAESSCGEPIEPKYAIDIMNGVRMVSAIPFQNNPFDAIFILIDLGLVKVDYDWQNVIEVLNYTGKKLKYNIIKP